MKKIIFLYLIILLIGCSNKKTLSDSTGEFYSHTDNSYNEGAAISEAGRNSADLIDRTGMETFNIFEEKLRYSGTVYNTIVNDDNVNVCSYPSLEADVLLKVNKNTIVIITGTSKEIDEIDNHTGHWFNVRLGWIGGSEGWIFSKYVESDQIAVSEIKIIGMSLQKEGSQAQKLTASYQIKGEEKIVTLYPHKEENQDFYTFAYDFDMGPFHYSNIPGSYAWYPHTNELVHISYVGTYMDSQWVIFTDDFKYMIKSVGTASGPRGLIAWRVEDGKEIFSGGYYRNINLKGYTINVIYEYNYWNITNNRLDSEILSYAEEYKNNNPIPDDLVEYVKGTTLNIELIIICEFNLDTGIREIITGQFIYTQ
ncbi:MAG: SH3 domain-containing protein [Treponema sp.]|jgi:uncharacterized protein YgiM (DUF1202 family)|nr:SH3 domain-containing protein [Treponema sp.]